MKKLIFIYFWFFWANNLIAQAPNFIWAKQFGGPSNFDNSNAVTTDANGNVYTAGFFMGTVDFDPGATTYNLTAAGQDIFISKIDINGNFLWAKQLGGVDDDQGYAIVLDANGNVYTTGFFRGTADFDPGSGTYNMISAGNADIFISKLDASGNFSWAKQLGGGGGNGFASAYSIAVDAVGNIYTTGGFYGTSDFDPGSGTYNLSGVSAGNDDVFVSKLDASGNFVWARQLGGTSYEDGRSIIVDASGNVYTTGHFQGTVDFNPGVGTYNMTAANRDIFISKLNASGNFLWAKQLGSANDDFGFSSALDAGGNIYTTGYFQGTADFDPGAATYNLTSAGSSDIFISKLDASGNFIWAKGIGSVNSDVGAAIVVDASGNVYTTGYFGGTTDFDPGPGTFNLTSAGQDEIFISKLDVAGNFVWANQMGGSSSDYGTSISIDRYGNIYSTGYFNSTADFDPGSGTFNMASLGGNDIFVTKFKEHSASTYQYTNGLSFGNDINGHAWNIWSANGSNVWDWHQNYVNGYLHYSFKVLDYAGFYCSGSCRYHNVWKKNPCLGFEITDVLGHDAVFPESSGNDHKYQVEVQWNSTGYHASVYDITSGTQYSNTDYAYSVNGNTYDSWTWGYSYWAGGTNYNDEDAIMHAQQWSANIYGEGPTGTTGGGGDIRTDALPIVQSTFIEPKIYLTKALLSPGETQLIRGIDFSSNGSIQLTIKNRFDELVGANIPINYLYPGKFTYVLPVTNSFKHGEYKVYATDLVSGKITPVSIFTIYNPVMQKLELTAPATNGGQLVNKPVQIRWVDFISVTQAIGPTGFVQKHYKIESSSNGGNTWQTIINSKLFSNVRSNQVNEFAYNYAFAQAGNYIIRITDVDNSANNNLSISFGVTTFSGVGFTQSLEWDKSILPLPSRIANPIGLSADGTSRLVIKLVKNLNNGKSVSHIEGSVVDQTGFLTGTALLGKIRPATVTEVYSDEANSAIATTCDLDFATPSISPSFSFWLVAPDDFTQSETSFASERLIKVEFTITYSDNSTTLIIVDDIKIVRPPLMMVHGLAGNNEAFANLKFNFGNGDISFSNAIENRTIWKYGKLPTMLPFSSFELNAAELLGGVQNSFLAMVKEMRSNGYACNRVDYVCHSMGGSIARSAINKYPLIYSSTKNYGKGFINKLITIATPHNGSPWADFFVDLTPASGIYLPFAFYNNIKGVFVQNGSNRFGSYYTICRAVHDLRAVNGGIRFGTTTVKNHLLGGDIDRYNVPDAALITAWNGNAETRAILSALALIAPGATTTADAIVNSVNAYISVNYGYPNFLSNSDFVVPVSSQFPNLNISSIPEVETTNTVSVATNSYGLNRNHLKIKDDLQIGTKVMRLLNSSINSNYFASQIAANPNPNGSDTYRNLNRLSSSDSILNYIDTLHVRILNPATNTTLLVDSTVNIDIQVKDTVGLKKIQVFFQREFYTSSSTTSIQSFNVKLHPDAIGNNMLMVKGVYDSSGFMIYHTDTAVITVSSIENIQGFYVTPKSQDLNSNQLFNLKYNIVFEKYVGQISDINDSLSFTIGNTNVVAYVDSTGQFVTKDTGTTYIVFHYKGFQDSIFIYIGVPVDENLANVCPDQNVSLNAGTSDSTKSYQWQVDTSSGFQDITPSVIYSGVNSSILLITSAPTSYYGYRYRCLISDPIGVILGPIFTLRFSATWTGASDTAWDNISNWGCSSLPDSNTDVIINSTATRFPQVNSNVSCRSLNLQPGAAILVKTGYSLLITH